MRTGHAMANKPLNELEGNAVGTLLAGIWSLLKSKDGKPTPREAVALMEGVELDCGGGTKLSIADGLEARLDRVLCCLLTDMDRVAQYMFENPEQCSALQLERALDIADGFVRVILYKLDKLGLIRHVSKNMYQINVTAWLKELQRREEADAVGTNDG